jgi:hypothetical protein
MNGHHYIGLRHRHTLERVEIAVPAQLTTDTIGVARDLEALWPDWMHLPGDITWRASYDQRAMPGNSQPDYHGPAAVRA